MSVVESNLSTRYKHQTSHPNKLGGDFNDDADDLASGGGFAGDVDAEENYE